MKTCLIRSTCILQTNEFWVILTGPIYSKSICNTDSAMPILLRRVKYLLLTWLKSDSSAYQSRWSM